MSGLGGRLPVSHAVALTPRCFPTRSNEYIEALGRLYASREGLVGPRGEPVEVAAELLTALDDGGNPDSWTQV